MIAAIGALAFLTVTHASQVEAPAMPSQPLIESDTQVPPKGSPSILVVLVNGDGSPAGELKSSKVESRVEVQVFEENVRSDSDLRVKPEDKPLAQSFVWMRELAYRMLDRSLNAKSQAHPCSTVSGFEKVIIVREVTEEEQQSTEPAEQRAERAITGLMSG